MDVVGFYKVYDHGVFVGAISLDDGANIVLDDVHAKRTEFGFTSQGLTYYQY